MQPGVTPTGLSSELSDSLRVYLNNKNRLQPIIGLHSIVECVRAGSRGGEALYLCEVCVRRLSKADVRNHILGSLHRYNYIKARHPEFVLDSKEEFDLPLLAWPLMERAKILEGREGPGDVKLVEVEDAVFQKMTRLGDVDALALVKSLRYGQDQPDSPDATPAPLQHHHGQSRRVVLPRSGRRKLKKCFRVYLRKTSDEQSQRPPTLKQSTAASSIESEGWLDNIYASQLNTQISSESEQSENGSSFLGGYAGTKPLIGLSRLVECRSKGGRTFAFLCRCCHARINKRGITDHMTSSSHAIKYLIELYPEQVTVADHNCLQSLIKRVEQEEGRGEPKVVKVPDSLCVLITSKSYSWCMRALSRARSHTEIQQRKMGVKWPNHTKTTDQGLPEKTAGALTKQLTRETMQRKTQKMTQPVFKVSLPLTKGPIVLERTSFSVDSLPMSPADSPPADWYASPSPESQTQEHEADYDSGSFATSQAEDTWACTPSRLQQDIYSEDAEYSVALYEDADYSYRDGDYSNQTADPQSQRVCEASYHNRWHQEGSQGNVYDGGQTYDERQTEGAWPANPHAQEWPSHKHTGRWYDAALQNNVDAARGEGQRDMNSNTTQHDYQQPDTQYLAHSSYSMGSCGYHGATGEPAPRFIAARIQTQPHLGYSHVHSDRFAPEPEAECLEVEREQLQACTACTAGHVHVPSYLAQPSAYQAVQVGETSNPGYNIGHWSSSDQLLPRPVSCGDGMSDSNVLYIPLDQNLSDETHSNVYIRGSGKSAVTPPGNVVGSTPSSPACTVPPYGPSSR